MALEPDELYGTSDSIKPLVRAHPYLDGIRPGKFAQLAGVASLPQLAPLVYDEGADQWTITDPAVPALNRIDGFLWVPGPNDFVPSATGEKLIQVFRRGLVHAGDVPDLTVAAVAPVATAPTAAQIAVLLKSPLTRGSGLQIQGIEGVH